MALTSEKLRGEINTAVREYLEKNGFTQTLTAFDAEVVALGKKDMEDTSLFRRWTVVGKYRDDNQKLHAKVANLESELTQLQDPQHLKRKQQDKLPDRCKTELRGHRDTITSVVFHPFDSLCFSSSMDGTIRVWDYESGEGLGTMKGGHVSAVQCIAVSHDGKMLASCSADTTVKIFDISAKECFRTLHGHDDAVYAVAWVPDGTLLSGGRDRLLKVWFGSTTGLLQHSVVTEEWIRAIVVNNNGPMIATAGSEEGYQPVVRIWTLLGTATQPSCIRTIPLHENVIEALVFSTFEADEVIIERYGTAEQKRYIRESKLRRKENSPPEDGKFIVTGSRDKNIKLVDVTSGNEIATMSIHENWVRGVGFAPNGKSIISCAEDHTVRIWDIAKSREVKVIPAHEHFVTCQGLHPGAKPYFLTGSADHTVKIWACS
eukprot:PhF_6_TR44483/c0_g1_i1/m.68495/K16794/PAFAH1B1, LIS1; platelet-activating factor acetylhydrolase IB subunit alpha